jgi:outer membrane protein assembly factor BamB
MKKLIVFALASLAIGASQAQEEMTTLWETKLDHEIIHTGTGTEERGYSYAASEKEITFFVNKTGRIKWTARFKDMAPKLSKIDELIPFWESNTVFLFDRKMGKDQIACIDMETGKTLWMTDKYQNVTEDNVVYMPENKGFAISLKDKLVFLKVSNGEELWSTSKFKGSVGKYIYMNDNSLVMVNYKPTALAALFSGFKNQIVRINMDNGDILWENTYIGLLEKKVLTREALCDLSVEADKVVLRLNGVQVYDYNTGASVWSAAFDYTPDVKMVGAPQHSVRFGVYGGVAAPVLDPATQNDLYVLDMSNKSNQFIKKYDVKTGKLIWSSSDIKGAKAIPGMSVIDNVVVLQIGGNVEAQAVISWIENRPDGSSIYHYEERVWYPNVKPTGVQAFNTADGKLLWESERFKKGITNSIVVDKNFIVCSGKALYSMDYKSGKENYEKEVAKGGVGNATLILPFKKNIIVVGEKGLSSFDAGSGELVASSPYKAAGLHEQVDHIAVLKTDKADIAVYDLNTLKYKQFKAKTGATTDLTEDADFVYVYEKKVVTKLNAQ